MTSTLGGGGGDNDDSDGDNNDDDAKHSSLFIFPDLLLDKPINF